MGASSYHYTKLDLDFGNSGHLWRGNMIVEADFNLKLLPTSILGIYKVCEALVC
jgi:hypothetical protein